jgi:hypothetical protein
VKVRLTRLVAGKLGPYAPRTDAIVGEASHPPIVGRSFVVVGASLDPLMDFRRYETSAVVEITDIALGQFRTESGSLYQVDALLGPFVVNEDLPS